MNVLISLVYECAFCGDALISIYVSSAVNDNFITKAEHWNISVVVGTKWKAQWHSCLPKIHFAEDVWEKMKLTHE